MTEPTQLISSRIVEIDAPAAVVWGVLTDFENYGAWNSFTPKVEVALDAARPIGSPVRIWLLSTGDRGFADFVMHAIQVFDPPKQLSWRHEPTLETPHLTRRDQYVIQASANTCQYYNTDTFYGESAADLFERHGAWVEDGLNRVATELKARAEHLAPAARF